MDILGYKEARLESSQIHHLVQDNINFAEKSLGEI